MTNDKTNAPGAVFWGISGIALVWNLIGLTAYWATVTMDAEGLKAVPEIEHQFYTDIPVWVTSAFAIAVTAGLLGSLALILRKKWAMPLFALSLAGIIVQDTHNFFMTDFLKVVGPDRLVLPALVFIVAIFLLWYSAATSKKGWLT